MKPMNSSKNKLNGKMSYLFNLDPCAFGSELKSQLISLFSLFLLLFIGSTTLFGIIHKSYYTISANFNLYLQYFQQKNFQFQQNKRIPNRP